MSQKNNIDDFWDISALVPRTKKPHPSKSKIISAVEITVAESQKQTNDSETSLGNIIPRSSASADTTDATIQYTPQNRLIKEVKISRGYSGGEYYDLFCRQAEYYDKFTPSECAHVHFFSYMPQFSQMNKAQINWYVWWKHCVNNNKFTDTDVTYILLYAFELINLGNGTNAAKSLDTMIELWVNYRDTYPQLNKTLGEWICDFLLLHKLNVSFPDTRLNSDAINSVSIPEIFYSFDLKNTPLLSRFLLSYCNSYNYRKSKAYDEKSAEFYEKHIPAVMERVVEESALGDKIFTETVKKTSRTAFMGALCSKRVRKRIDVSYVALSLENELRTVVADIIKYSENKLRGELGIRSRLNVKYISDSSKSIIDRYFRSTFKETVPSLNVPEYEKLYDAKSEPLSFEKAAMIEQTSWDITQRLVEAFEDETDVVEPVVPPEQQIVQSIEDEEGDELNQFYSAIKKHIELFELIKDEKFNEQISFVKSHRIIFEAAADEINEAAAEIFGDILIEEADIGYRIIDDYKEIFNL